MQRFETKYDLLKAAYEDRNLKKNAIAILQYLVHKSNKEKCFPTVETIAKALNVCKRTVQYNMRKLEKAGYIIRIDRWYNHQQLSNQYVFNFGIKEDRKVEMKYSDNEYNKLNQEIVTSSYKIYKAREIVRIYNMELSNKEKLLLVYLVHRANQKNMTYETIENYMRALGVGRRSLEITVHKLQSKNLIKVRYMLLKHQEYFVMQLTGANWSNTVNQEASETVRQNIQRQDTDQNQDIEKSVQFIQRKNKEDIEADRRVGKKVRSRLWKPCRFRTFLSKCKYSFRKSIDRIRKLLRI